MRTKIEYPWHLRITYILLVGFFSFLIIPLPYTVYLIIKRLEYKQLCRLIIAKILSIDFYMEEIAEIKGEKYDKRFNSSFEINEIEYHELSKLQDELHREYDLLVFQKVLNEKIESFGSKRKKPIKLNINNIQKEAEVEKMFIEQKVRERQLLEEKEWLEKQKRIKKEKWTFNTSGEFFKEPSMMNSEEKSDTLDSGDIDNIASRIPNGKEKIFGGTDTKSKSSIEPLLSKPKQSPFAPVDDCNDQLTSEGKSQGQGTKEKDILKSSTPKEEAKKSVPRKKAEKERVRPVMKGSRIYLSEEDFDEVY